MNVVIDTRIAGSPAGCRRTAREIRTLGRALGEATAVCERQRFLPTSEFGGLAGAAFRVRVTALAATTRAGWKRCEALAAGLDRLVDELTGCEVEMASIRSRAEGLLHVRDGSIHRPSRTEGSGAEAAWITAVRAVAAVRRRESAAQAEWEDVLRRPWETHHDTVGDIGHAAWVTGQAIAHGPHVGPTHHPPPQGVGDLTHPAHETSDHLAPSGAAAHSGTHPGTHSGTHSGVGAELVCPEYAAELVDPQPGELGTAPVYYREEVTTGGS